MRHVCRSAVGVMVLLAAALAVQGAGHPAKPDVQPPAAVQEGISVWFSPDGGCTEAIVAQIHKATRTIHLQAYSFTSSPIAKARGVQIVAILDKSQRTEKYSSATFLNNQGITTRIDDAHAIAHNKIILIDGKVIITGSFNFTASAEDKNAENLLILQGKGDLYAAYEKNFQEHLKHSEKY